MGYRSTIIFGVEKRYSSKLDEILKEYQMTPDERVSRDYPNYQMVKDEFGDFKSCKKVDDIQMVIYKFEYMKWYEDYDDVMAVTKYLKVLSYSHEETTFLIGLGEDNQIHSRIGDWWEYVDHVSKLEIQE
jgi:hypothetical protein